jgi:hypothetical protein
MKGEKPVINNLNNLHVGSSEEKVIQFHRGKLELLWLRKSRRPNEIEFYHNSVL